MSLRVVRRDYRITVASPGPQGPGGGGGGSSDHATLSNLSWTLSGHTGAIDHLAGFNSAGDAEEIPISTLGRSLIAQTTSVDALATIGAQAATDLLTSLSDLDGAGSGLVVTSGGAAYQRSIAVGSGLSVADPTGVAGNPTISLGATLAAVVAGTWTGATSITTLGTIATGTWQGTAIGASYIADLSATYIATAQKAAASGVASLNGSSKVVQDPANATATPTASKIPIADGSGVLDSWISAATQLLLGLRAAPFLPSFTGTAQQATGVVVTSSAGTTGAIADRLYGVRYTHDGPAAELYASIQWQVTTLTAGNGALALFAPGSDGMPGALLWYSANQDTGTTGFKTVAFSAGTWTTAGNAYKSGTKLRLYPGQVVFMGLHASAAHTFASYAATVARGIGTTGPATWSGTSYVYRSSAFGSGVPDPFGTPTLAAATATPCIGLVIDT